MIKYRKMEERDIEAVAEIERACFSLPWSEKDFRDSLALEAALFLVAEEDEEILGYAGVYISLDEGEITNVAVGEKARRRGVATGLLHKMEKSIYKEGVRRVLLEVREHNIGAISLYKGLGFKDIAVRKNFYEFPTEDGILMEHFISV